MRANLTPSKEKRLTNQKMHASTMRKKQIDMQRS
jgi:hypothetical protein